MRDQYWAQIIEVDEEMSPCCVMTDTVESAAESMVQEYIEATEGEFKFGVVRVWEFDQPDATAKVYSWEVEFEVPEDLEANEDDEFEIDGSITLTERV